MNSIIRILNSILFIVLFVLSNNIQAKNNPKAVPVNHEKVQTNLSVTTHMGGYLGRKIDLCIDQRIKKQDVKELIAPFKSRTETRLWQTDNLFELQTSTEKPEHVWISFTAPLILGTDLEGESKLVCQLISDFKL